MTTNLFRTSNGVIAGPTNIHGACSGRADAAGDLTAAYGLISLETSEAGRSVSRPLGGVETSPYVLYAEHSVTKSQLPAAKAITET